MQSSVESRGMVAMIRLQGSAMTGKIGEQNSNCPWYGQPLDQGSSLCLAAQGD